MTIEALVRANEYCLFFIDWWPMCMTKSEWSGWAQAFGVASAFYIAWWSNKQQRINEYLRRIVEKSEVELLRLVYLKEDLIKFRNYMRSMRIVPGHVTLSKEFIPYLNIPDDYRLSEQPGLYFMTGIGGWKILKNELIRYYFIHSNRNVAFINQTINGGEEFIKEFLENIDIRISNLQKIVLHAERRLPPPNGLKEPSQYPLEHYLPSSDKA